MQSEDYEITIGCEIHLQLLTVSKAFCSCSAEYGAPPNTNVCPVCLGMPGALPTINERMIDCALLLGKELNCEFNLNSRFARKNYFYRDLPKGYQITQFDKPLCESGRLEIETDGGTKAIRIERIHPEEDSAKTINKGDGTYLLDFNRSGVPLLEIVSAPDMNSGEQAQAFAEQIRNIARYLEISSGQMQEGALRCDANVSIRKKDAAKLGNKAEVKNMNSFRNIGKAIDYEIKRQINIVENGGRIENETRSWNEQDETTVPTRSKEEQADYMYFPEPDLPPMEIKSGKLSALKQIELPLEKKKRFVEKYKLDNETATVLTQEKPLADFYDSVCGKIGGTKPKASQKAAALIKTEILNFISEGKIAYSDLKSRADNFATLINKILAEEISESVAKDILSEVIDGAAPEALIEREGLRMTSDESEIERLAKEAIKENPRALAKYKSGKTKTIGFFVGQIMKKSGGKANPKLAKEVAERALDEY